MRGLKLGFGIAPGRFGAGGPALVLTSFIDDLDQDPPAVSFISSEEGTLYIDYHTGATAPTLGAGDIGGTTQAISIGTWSDTLDLSAFVGDTFYIYFRLLYDTDQVSNTLRSQQVTVSAGQPIEWGAANELVWGTANELTWG